LPSWRNDLIEGKACLRARPVPGFLLALSCAPPAYAQVTSMVAFLQHPKLEPAHAQALPRTGQDAMRAALRASPRAGLPENLIAKNFVWRITYPHSDTKRLEKRLCYKRS
jgi:hypothetical protein